MSLIKKTYQSNFGLNPLAAANNLRKKVNWTPVFRGLDVLSIASMPAYFLIPDATTRQTTQNLKTLENNPTLQQGVEKLGKVSIANPSPNVNLPKPLPPNSLM